MAFDLPMPPSPWMVIHEGGDAGVRSRCHRMRDADQARDETRTTNNWTLKYSPNGDHDVRGEKDRVRWESEL
jgi:hypothetical protein